MHHGDHESFVPMRLENVLNHRHRFCISDPIYRSAHTDSVSPPQNSHRRKKISVGRNQMSQSKEGRAMGLVARRLSHKTWQGSRVSSDHIYHFYSFFLSCSVLNQLYRSTLVIGELFSQLASESKNIQKVALYRSKVYEPDPRFVTTSRYFPITSLSPTPSKKPIISFSTASTPMIPRVRLRLLSVMRSRRPLKFSACETKAKARRLSSRALFQHGPSFLTLVSLNFEHVDAAVVIIENLPARSCGVTLCFLCRYCGLLITDRDRLQVCSV